jgi:hypothetical protein
MSATPTMIEATERIVALSLRVARLSRAVVLRIAAHHERMRNISRPDTEQKS